MFEEEILHPLDFDGEIPESLNNPFNYDPHPACVAAVDDLRTSLPRLFDGASEGKMFGVLVVRKNDDKCNKLYYLCAFSGQIGDKSILPGFVPPVFDILEPGGYFKNKEREISEINRKISEIEESPEFISLYRNLSEQMAQSQIEIENAKSDMLAAKKMRDARRAEGNISDEENRKFVKQSQFLKAELRRTKTKWKSEMAESFRKLSEYEILIEELKNERKLKSDFLQRWIFEQYKIVNYRSETKNLIGIFDDFGNGLPPAGTGDCCEPKLLQYAYTQKLIPLQMAMFWWGRESDDELRRHLKFYPACSGKCRPVLNFMLPEAVFDVAVENAACKMEILYQDSDIWVIDKPSGMLSVPGKSARSSVISVLRSQCAENEHALTVHRLDMDTSGIMVVAKNRSAQSALRRQFERREVKKTYMAVLDGEPLPVGESGIIDLPLIPDVMHRPFQKVDFVSGRTALTNYRVADGHIVELEPETGRTHQLRVHCAHKSGLGRPIKGDNLYGKKADRLHLYAVKLSFRHPATGEPLEFVRNVTFVE